MIVTIEENQKVVNIAQGDSIDEIAQALALTALCNERFEEVLRRSVKYLYDGDFRTIKLSELQNYNDQ
jgi:hypothetical protein